MVTSKTIGTRLQLHKVQVVGNILILEMSHLNICHLNNSNTHNTRVLLKVLHSSLRRKKRIAKIYLDRQRSFEWKIRMPARRQMKSRCPLQADLRRPDRRANRTRRNLALRSRLHRNRPRLLPNPKYLRSSMQFLLLEMRKPAQNDLEVHRPNEAFQPNQHQLDSPNSESHRLLQPERSRRF